MMMMMMMMMSLPHSNKAAANMLAIQQRYIDTCFSV
jgi:hypothetical protein